MSDESTRVSVYLTPPAANALEEISHRTHDTRTDVISRALLLYRAVADVSDHEGMYLVTVDDFDGRPLYLMCWRQPFAPATRRWWQRW